MGIYKKVKELLSSVDLFSSPVSLRYKQQGNYETATGGFCSIVLIIVFIAIFTGTVIQTINRAYINHRTTIFEETVPSYYNTSVNSEFMFAVGVTDLNLNLGKRYFDVSFEFRNFSDAGRYTTELGLQPCKVQAWQYFGQQFGNNYDRLRLNEWLCPPTDINFQLQGKFTSEQFKYYRISLKKCNASIHTDRQCATDSQIAAFLAREQIYFSFYFINKLLNPTNQTYITRYLQDSNFFPFSSTVGTNADIFINSYSIQTDESILPVQDINQTTGGFVSERASSSAFAVTGTTYAKLTIRKSPISYRIDRSYRKADDTLSYVGGLFSSIIGLLIFMGVFTQFSYEIDMAKLMFVKKKDEHIDSDGFNFLVFLGYLFYLGLTKLCIYLPWQRMQNYYKSIQEVRQQLDIRLIMKKIQYAEKIHQAILQEHQLMLLHLQQPLTIQQAEQKRNRYKHYRQVIKKLNKNQLKFHKINKRERQDSSLNLIYQSEQSPTMKKDDIIVPQQINEKKSVEQQLIKNLKNIEQDLKLENKISNKIFDRTDKKIVSSYEKHYLKSKINQKVQSKSDNFEYISGSNNQQ